MVRVHGGAQTLGAGGLPPEPQKSTTLSGKAMSPNRTKSTAQRMELYTRLVQRDGPLCANADCLAYPTSSSGHDIHHIDHDPSNNQFSNRCLLCKTCNRSRNDRPDASMNLLIGQPGKMVGLHVQNSRAVPPERKREITNGYAHLDYLPPGRVQAIVSYRSGSPEMQANHFFKPRYQQWLTEQIEQGPITKQEAIDAGAFVVQCNVQTAGRLLRPLVSGQGPFELVKDYEGTEYVQIKPVPILARSTNGRTSGSPPATKPAAAARSTDVRTSSARRRARRNGEP